jgi:hypothetical protein
MSYDWKHWRAVTINRIIAVALESLGFIRRDFQHIAIIKSNDVDDGEFEFLLVSSGI